MQIETRFITLDRIIFNCDSILTFKRSCSVNEVDQYEAQHVEVSIYLWH
jgi:hypothetical protein